MSRIALVLAGPHPHPRGSQMLLRQLEGGLRSRGHEVLVLSHGPDAPSAPVLGPRRVWRDLRLAQWLWRVARTDGLDVIHAHNYEATLIALPIARALGVPLVFHGHAAFRDELPHYVAAWCRRPARWIGERLDRWVPRWSDAVVTVTPALAACLIAGGVPSTQVTCVPPALSPHDRQPTSIEAEVANRICYAGNLDGYQNLAFLRAAFTRVRAIIPAAELVIATDAVAAASADWTHVPGVAVHWEADIATVRSTLATAAVAVLPRTDPTGFPMKLLNYLAAARAVVVCQGAAQGLRSGVDALVVPDGDVAAFAAAIITLLQDPAQRHKLGAAASQRVNPAAADAALDQIESIYRRVGRPTVPHLRPITQAE